MSFWISGYRFTKAEVENSILDCFPVFDLVYTSTDNLLTAEKVITVHYKATDRVEQYTYDKAGNRTSEAITQQY